MAEEETKADEGWVTVKRKRKWKRSHDGGSENAPAKRISGAVMRKGERMYVPDTKFDTFEFVNDGVTHKGSFNFDGRFRPHIISELNKKNLPQCNFSKPDARPTLFKCPSKVAGLWMQAMFQKAKEVAEECRTLCSKWGLSDETYNCNSCHLEFHIGHWMTLDSWHSHITLSLHGYFLRMWSRVVTKKLEARQNRQIYTGKESWSMYVKGRQQCLAELKEEHIEYQKRDAGSIEDTLKSLEEEEERTQPSVPLSTQQETTLKGCRMLYTFDPDCAGNAVVGLRFPKEAKFDTSAPSALGDVASAISVFCKQFGFSHLYVFVFQDNTIHLIVEVSSFMRCLSLSDARVWAKRWHNPCADSLPAARATQVDLSELNEAEPNIGQPT